jgi:hypothetical protein
MQGDAVDEADVTDAVNEITTDLIAELLEKPRGDHQQTKP